MKISPSPNMVGLPPSIAVAGLFCSLAGAGLAAGDKQPSQEVETSVLPATSRYNVLLIATDDLRNDLGCYGNPHVKTPNIDRLAKRGVLFTRSYAQQALCNPSRASMMTGRRPDSIRVWNLRTHFRDNFPDIVTMPQLFKESGYFSEGIGKIYHNGGRFSEDPQSWSVPAVMHMASHYDDVAFINGKPSREPNRDIKTECLDVPDNAYFDGRIADMAVDAINRAKERGTPFFLGVGFWKPHLPYNVPKKYWDMYKREEISMPDPADWPKDAPRIAWHNSQELLGTDKDKRMRKLVLDDEKILELRHGYYAGISYVDAQVGRVLDALEQQGLAEDTIVVFYSDHGFHLGEQTLWCKSSNFELDARVPLILSVPGKAFAKGISSDALVELLDVYPTLASLCGLTLPDRLEGADLSAVLKNPNARVKKGAITQHPRPAYNTKKKPDPDAMGYSIRMEGIRYTEWRKWGSDEVIAAELYDYKDTPVERVNVINNPAYKGKIDEARSLLRASCPPLIPDLKR